jgi:hypothetical protein
MKGKALWQKPSRACKDKYPSRHGWLEIRSVMTHSGSHAPEERGDDYDLSDAPHALRERSYGPNLQIHQPCQINQPRQSQRFQFVKPSLSANMSEGWGLLPSDHVGCIRIRFPSAPAACAAAQRQLNIYQNIHTIHIDNAC